MKFFFVLLLALALITPAFSIVECDSESYCADGYTCCRTNSGWGCCRYSSAVCCGGSSCCPSGSSCSSSSCNGGGFFAFLAPHIPQEPLLEPAIMITN
mmetsp:Transcript_78104/g.91204  ORF Transcript_78104/g.91204 Transcript_78104/m.91204 type:complete len:98 (-) Transcript_78104:612-905(-)